MKDWCTKLFHVLFHRWRFLSLYLLFTSIVLNGWYINVVSFFSSSNDYIALVKAQNGDINILNVIVFIIGSVVFGGYLWIDVKHKRLERMIASNISIKNTSLIGDANQAVTQNSQNSPALTNSPGSVVTYNFTGITEERCRAIFDEKWLIAARDFTYEAIAKAEKRAQDFRTELLHKMSSVNNGFNAFGDPAFQFLLMDAQKAAATTERKNDYQILSELLANRTQMGNEIKSQIYLKKAVEMVPYISDDALLGLTAYFLLLNIVPSSGIISKGLEVLDELFKKTIDNNPLPKGEQWIESLEACGLAKITLGSLMSMNKSAKILSSHLEGYVQPGIKKDSEIYRMAVEIIEGVNLPTNILVEHELDIEYVRLCIFNEDRIDGLILEKHADNGVKRKIPLNEQQKKALHRVYALYEKDQTIKMSFEHKLDEETKKYPYLKMVKEWWDSIDVVFQFNQAGIILANANAKKCDAKMPIIEA